MAPSYLADGRVRIDIDWRKVDLLTMSPDGDVVKFIKKLSNEIQRKAAKDTESGTGKARARVGGAIQSFPSLANSYYTYHRYSTPDRVQFRVGNRKHYAKYVFLGTTGPITAGGRNMPVGKSQLGLFGVAKIPKGSRKGIRFVQTVDGQRGKNYPLDAARAVFARHGLR